MHKLAKIWGFLLPLLLALAACSGSTPPGVQGKAAHHEYIIDMSDSPATVNDATVTKAVEARIASDMKRNVRLGDELTLYQSGASSADRMVSKPTITTGYNLRLPVAQTKLIGQFREIVAEFHATGGDASTHLVQSLEAIHPDCSSGRDVITLVTDGLEEDEAVSSARALTAGKPVTLSPPPGRYLAGCKLVFLGFGLTSDTAGNEQLLPPNQLAALRQGWMTYLQAAGVRPEDVEFVSAF